MRFLRALFLFVPLALLTGVSAWFLGDLEQRAESWAWRRFAAETAQAAENLLDSPDAHSMHRPKGLRMSGYVRGMKYGRGEIGVKVRCGWRCVPATSSTALLAAQWFRCAPSLGGAVWRWRLRWRRRCGFRSARSVATRSSGTSFGGGLARSNDAARLSALCVRSFPGGAAHPSR